MAYVSEVHGEVTYYPAVEPWASVELADASRLWQALFILKPGAVLSEHLFLNDYAPYDAAGDPVAFNLVRSPRLPSDDDDELVGVTFKAEQDALGRRFNELLDLIDEINDEERAVKADVNSFHEAVVQAFGDAMDLRDVDPG